ncbi:cytochrome P450 monooxygenase [Thermothelomyces thermophilus ATCC 42464]|uniref:Cytochrome P450 monooxygenase ABA1 n=1 Tax=Thermothelomyces thermophilus (strain ATCC 42464 / BCRC 31852 / DSM 1799) TaxID=573729 RepID=G2QMP6_THET4|nr:cytochrome P450 monooxygenase [Thermothelomyces thermophilus ATCC 42464]AEO61226.1 cytochrome P450 monooxygenase [Thermothelomyces thermophilus ATCC 42464]
MAVANLVELSRDRSAGGWLLALGAVAATYYVISSIVAWWRLREFKGPFLASFSYMWLGWISYSGRMSEYMAKAEAKYGGLPPSTIRIGPNELLTSDPDVIRRSSGARSRYTRSNWYKAATLDPYDPAMLSTLDTAAHDRLKAQTAPGYAGKENATLEPDLDAMLGQMTDKIRTKYAAATPGDVKPMLDLAMMVQYFTLDSISKLAFGEEFGFLRAEGDIHGYLETVESLAPTTVTILALPFLRDILTSKFMLSLLGPTPKDKRGMGVFMRIGRSIVDKRFAREDPGAIQDMLVSPPTLLGSFIRHGLTRRQCETESLVQIVAGSDTTATAIRTGLLYLMTNPRAYRALQAEIDEGIRDGRISSPITSAEAAKLPYLQAVIYETLRIHPPLTATPFKVVPPEGDTIDGKRVPGGTLVAPDFWTTSRNRALFGPDVDVFRPERWLLAPERGGGGGGGGADRAEMRRVAEMAFGYGRWMCAGKMIAFLELNKVFVELLRRFDFQLVYPSRPWKCVNYNLFLQREMWVSVSLREEPKPLEKN